MRSLLAGGRQRNLQQLVPRGAGRQAGRTRNRHPHLQADHYDVTGVAVRAADAAAELGGVGSGAVQQERAAEDRAAEHETGRRQREDFGALRVSLLHFNTILSNFYTF